MAPTPTPQGLAGFLIGLWEYHEGDTYFTIDFAPDGSFISASEGDYGTYKVVSEHTILINGVGSGDLVLGVQDFQGDTMTIREPAEIAGTYHRLASVPDLAEAIIGFWINSGENSKFAVEFTTNGTVIGRGFGEFLLGKYKVLTNNSIEVYDTDYQKEHPEGRIFFQFVGATHDTLTLYLVPFSTIVLTRVEEIPDVANKIVGFWQIEPGIIVEFTADGHFINHGPDGGVIQYEVISNNTIFLKGSELIPFNIIHLSNDSLSSGSWSEVYIDADQPETWTRVNP